MTQREAKSLTDEWQHLMDTDRSDCHDSEGKLYTTISPEKRLVEETIKTLRALESAYDASVAENETLKVGLADRNIEILELKSERAEIAKRLRIQRSALWRLANIVQRWAKAGSFKDSDLELATAIRTQTDELTLIIAELEGKQETK